MKNSKTTSIKTGRNSALFCSTAMLLLAVILLLPGNTRAQTPATVRYLSGDDVKNYSVEAITASGTPSPGVVMAGTAFNVYTTAGVTNRNAVHFLRLDDQGVVQASIYMHENGSDYYEERCVDIAADPNNDNVYYITSLVRYYTSSYAQDRIKVYVVDKMGGMVNDFIISSTTSAAGNLYPIHTLLHGNDLFVCGFTTGDASTTYPSSPTYIDGPSGTALSRVAKQAFVMKVNLSGSGSVSAFHTYDYTYSTGTGAANGTPGSPIILGANAGKAPDEVYNFPISDPNYVNPAIDVNPNTVDYDMAMRMTYLPGSNHIHVTGSVTGMHFYFTGAPWWDVVNTQYSAIMNLAVDATSTSSFTVTNRPFGDGYNAYGTGLVEVGGSSTAFYLVGNHYLPEIIVTSGSPDYYGMAPYPTDYFLTYMTTSGVGDPEAKYSADPYFIGKSTYMTSANLPSLGIPQTNSWALMPLPCPTCTSNGNTDEKPFWVAGYTHTDATCPLSSTSTTTKGMLDQLDAYWSGTTGINITPTHQLIYATLTGTGGTAANNHMDLGYGLSNIAWNPHLPLLTCRTLPAQVTRM